MALLRSFHLPNRVISILLWLGLLLHPHLGGAESTIPKEIVPLSDSEAEDGGRGYNWVSIHPDGNRWLITECMAQHRARVCGLFLFDFRSGRYQRYALPPGYFYMHGRFSVSGNVIVAERNPQPREGTADEKMRLLRETEVIRLNIDGTGFQVLPVPKGYLTYPTMSPDETKIAYWSATDASIRGGLPRSQEVREFDLETKADRLFAGPFNFWLGGNLEYRTNDEIAVQTFSPAARAKKIESDGKQYAMEVVQIRRDATVLPEPLVAQPFMYVTAMADQKQQLHYMLQLKSREFAVVKKTAEGDSKVWKSPPLPQGGPAVVAVPPDGRYAAFIYMTSSTLTANLKNRLGFFCWCNGKWYSVRLPAAESAEAIGIQ